MKKIRPSAVAKHSFAFYAREGIRIAFWNDAAIRRAAGDNGALSFGFSIWFVPLFLGVADGAIRARIAGRAVNWAGVLQTLASLAVIVAIQTILQFAICHFLARWAFHGQGTFIELLRPLLLGQIVTWIAIVPVVGPIAAGVWAIAVLFRVLQEIETIEQIHAAIIAVGVGGLFLALNLGLFSRL